MPTTRRAFLSGAAATLAAATAGPRLAFASEPQAAASPLLVHVHLRGGLDGLRLLAPRSGAARARYESLRPTLGVPASRLLALGADALGGDLGMHGAAEPLLAAWAAGRLAILPAVGLETAPRDRAAAERAFHAASPDGFAAESAAQDGLGWLARHLETAPERHDEIYLPAVGLGGAAAVEGSPVAWTADDLESLRVEGFETALARTAIEALQGDDVGGRQTVAALEIADWLRAGPALEDPFPSSALGRQLARITAIDAEGIGLRVASVVMDGWDLRDGDERADGFTSRVEELAEALAALDRAFVRRGAVDRLVVVVESESGRSLGEAAGRTTLGHAAPMLVLGGRVAGGIHGGLELSAAELSAAELSAAELSAAARAGLRPTIDRREVLAHVLEEHLGNAVGARALRAAQGPSGLRLLRT